MYCVHGSSGTSILLFEFFDDELERDRDREREREKEREKERLLNL